MFLTKEWGFSKGTLETTQKNSQPEIIWAIKKINNIVLDFNLKGEINI